MEIAADYVRLLDYTTVYRAEIKAMIEVRQHQEGDDRFIKTFSDSQAALKKKSNAI